MSELNKQKIEQLLPYELLVTKKWLLSKGLSLHTVDNALKSRKLEPVATGVYSRKNMSLSWQGVVCSLQMMGDECVAIGGMSALSLLGYNHYLSNSKIETFHLYSEKKLPSWLGKLRQKFTFKWRSTKRIWPHTTLVDEQYSRELEWREGLAPLKLSCPEKAFLEMLTDVPKSISFDHANEIMQGMTSLSPNKLEKLLKACKSIKAKRLFLWFAEKQGYAWFKKLDLTNVDLGAGNRVIAKDGKLNKKYLITVPEHLYG